MRNVSTLSPPEVVDIRQRYHDGYSAGSLGELFDIDVRYVSRIASGEARRDVPVDLPPWTPLCMGYDAYRLWKDNRVGSNFTITTPRPCDDCPLTFAAEQATLGLCNGIPGDVVLDADEVPMVRVPHRTQDAA